MKRFIKQMVIGAMTFFGVWIAAGALPLTDIAVTDRPECALGGAFDGERYLIGLQLDGESNAVQFVSAAGVPEGAPILIPGALGMPPDVAYGTNVFLVAWVGEDGHVRGQFVSRTGELLRETFWLSGTMARQDYGTCRVASGAGNFLVVWEDLWAEEAMMPDAGTDVIGHIVPEEYVNCQDGRFPPNPFEKSNVISLDDEASIEKDDRNLSIGFDGTNFLVVFTRDGGDDGEDVCGRFVSPVSGPISSRFVIDENDIPSCNPTATVFADGRYVVLFHESIALMNAESWQIYARFISTNGVVAADRILLAGSETVAAQYPSLGWNGSHLLVALREGAPDHWEEGLPEGEEGEGMDVEEDYIDTNAVIRARWFDAALQPTSDWLNVTDPFGDNEAVLGTLMLPSGAGFALGIQTFTTNWTPVNVYGAVVQETTTSSLFSSVTIWRSLEADGPALFEVDVSAPTGKTITVTVPTVPATVYDVTEEEAGEYEYFDNTVANLEAQYPQGDYVLRLYSDAGKTILEETLVVSFGDGSGDPLPFPEVYPALTQPVPDGDQIHAVPEQTYIWDSYSGTAGTATHMHLGLTGTGEADEDIAEYDAEIDGSCSFTPPPVAPGDYDLELSFFFRHSGQTAGGTLLEFANERSSRYALTVANPVYELSATSGPYAGGNTVTISNGNLGTVTNVLVGGVAAAIVDSGATWVTITIPALGSSGVKDIVIQTSDQGDITLAGIYTVNPAGVIGSDQWAAVAAGQNHSLGLKSDGSIVAWGYNDYGQTAVPAPNTDFVSLSGGYSHSLGLKSDGSITAWGSNIYGQTNVPSPNTDFVALAAGGYHSLGLKPDGTLVAWGRNYYGQTSVPSPNTDFVAVAAGEEYSLGLKADGSIVAWGVNQFGQTAVPSPNTDFVAVAAGANHSLGLKSDGSIVAWGLSNDGRTVVPSPNTDFVALSGGYEHSLGLKSDGSIVAWGDNDYGQTDVPSPNTDFVAVAGRGHHSLGLKSDGSIVAWGYNYYGQTNVPSPNANFGLPSGVQPKSGSWQGGYEVVISGSNLGNGSDITHVTLCGISAAIVSQSSTQVVVTAGEGLPGTGDVAVYSTSYGVTTKADGFTYLKTDQTIAFPAIGDQLATDTVVLSATASSGLPVTFSVLEGPASISDGTNLTFTGAGTVSVVASQAGDAYWNAAPDATNTFNVVQGAPVIEVSGNLSFGEVTTGTTATATMTITNSGDATLTVTGITYPDGFSGAWSGTIAAGHATNVTVTFAPVAVTAYSGTVTVNSDAVSGTSTLSASGTGTYQAQAESLFSSVTIWRSLEADGPALFEVDVSAPEGKTITVTVPTEPATVYDVTEDEAGEYEYFDNTVANLEAQYPQGDYELRLYSDAGKTILEETLMVSFGDGSGDPLPFPEVYPALTQPVPDVDQIHAVQEQTYIWDSYSGTAGTATHMYLEITGTGEADEDIAEYDAEIDGSCSFTPPPVAPGDYDLELSFFFRHSGQTAGGTLVECANERYARYALTVANPVYQLTVTGGSGSGTYTNGAIVSITADAPVFGRMFVCWTGDTQYVAAVSNATTSVTMPGEPVTLTATYQLIPVETAYFDSFEAAQLNPFWVPSLQNGTITPSSDKAYAGAQSVKFSAPGGGQKYLFLRHFFERAQHGTVSVWVYDSKEYIYFGMQVKNSAISDWGAAIFNMDWDYETFYYTANMNTGEAIKSSVVRSAGWRKFTIRSFKNELVLDVDGQEMYRGPGVEPFDCIQLHLSGPSSGTIYFDEFSFVPEIAGRVADPVFEPASGTIFTNELVTTLSCATEGASLYYTTDGSEPTEASALYEAPLVLTETTTLKVRAFKASYYPSETASALFTRAYTLADAVGCRQLLFATGGDAPWFMQSAVVREGTDAAQSGAIGDRQSSWMETSVEGPGTLSFHWKVSCEDDTLFDDWDYVAVTVNGIEVARRDGITEWELVQLPLEAGMHTVRWVYTKDRVVSEGMDCAWVDGVSWTPAPLETQTTPVPVPHLWLDLHKLVINGDYETAAFSDTDGDGHLAWEEYVAITDPGDPESLLRVQIHFENGMPVVTWDPDHGTDRSYHLEGRASLSAGDWEPAAESHRFFRVMVDLP